MAQNGLQNFVAEVWEARLMKWIPETFVYGDIVNTDYEDEIKGLGSTVRINTYTDIQVHDYVKGVDVELDQLDSLQTTMAIDQAKAWGTFTHSVDQNEMTFNAIDAAMQSAAVDLKGVIDSYIFGFAPQAGMKYAAQSTALTVAKIEAFFARLNRMFDEDDLPEDGRWITLPAWMVEKMYLAKVIRETNNSEILANGNVGNYQGWQVKRSNRIGRADVGGKMVYDCMAGVTKNAVSFAFKPIETRPYNPEKRFEHGVMGLCIYGAKVLRPDYLMLVQLDEGAEA